MRNRHKTRGRWAIFVLLTGLAAPPQLWAQVARDDVPAIRVGDVVALVIGAGVAVAPRFLGWGADRVPCAPCDPMTLPVPDRWALRRPHPTWGSASWLALGGLAVMAVADVGARDGGGPHLTGMAESLVWTTAVTEVLKAGVGRPRPEMYHGSATAGSQESFRSFPSGHTSAAFAVATAYWLARRDLTGSPGAAGWAAVGIAGSVGVLRVLAGKHFPTDVLAGALLGIAGGAVVHAVKF